MSDLTAEVRAALAAASPAPWKACTEEWSLAGAGDIPVVDAMGDYLCCSPDDGVRGGHSEADAALIAAAPSWLAALCDHLDAAEAKLTAAKAALSTHTTEAYRCTCTECQIARILNGDPNAE